MVLGIDEPGEPAAVTAREVAGVGQRSWLADGERRGGLIELGEDPPLRPAIELTLRIEAGGPAARRLRGAREQRRDQRPGELDEVTLAGQVQHPQRLHRV